MINLQTKFEVIHYEDKKGKINVEIGVVRGHPRSSVTNHSMEYI